jgi:uncharacterized membrane protein YphA (DoxX/SURF4 family)
MKKPSFHILRVGLAITFLWIGILIFKNPEAWGGYIQPWAEKLLPMPIKDIMIGTAFLDMAIGFLLLIDVLVPWVALIGGLHLVTVLTVSGINEGTVRDIAILAGAFAIFFDSMPKFIEDKFIAWKNRKASLGN